MGMVAILFNDAEQFEQIDYAPWQKAQCDICWKLVKLF